MPKPDRFKQSLAEFRLSKDMIDAICFGYETVTNQSSKKRQADFFRHACTILDEQLDFDSKCALLECNACSIGGTLERNSRLFGTKYNQLPLEEKLEKIGLIKHMGQPTLNEDGTITVVLSTYCKDGKYVCACRTLNGSGNDAPISRTYCLCCGGHIKRHYELMLNAKLKVAEIVSTPLDTNGENPCVIKITFA